MTLTLRLWSVQLYFFEILWQVVDKGVSTPLWQLIRQPLAKAEPPICKALKYRLWPKCVAGKERTRLKFQPLFRVYCLAHLCLYVLMYVPMRIWKYNFFYVQWATTNITVLFYLHSIYLGTTYLYTNLKNM